MALRPLDLGEGEIYSSAWLRSQGMHPRQLASSQMTRVLPGYFTRSDAPADLRSIALIAQTVLCPGAVVSHETAAELFRIPLPRGLTRAGGASVHVSVSGGTTARSTPLLTVHVRGESPVIRHHGVTMSHPVVAVQEISSRLSHPDLVACLDALVANRHGAAYPMPLRELLAYSRTRKGRGATALRAAAEDARERVWSPMESHMRLMLVGHGHPEPELNREIRDPATGIVYYIDLAYPQWRIAIEYDGAQHRTDKAQWEADLQKNEVLHAQGWSVLRVSSADLHAPKDFFLRLEAAIRRRTRSIA